MWSALVNPDRHHRLDGLEVLHQEVKKITWTKQMAIIMTHPDFVENNAPQELHAVKHFCKVTAEGDPDMFVEAMGAVAEQETAETTDTPAVELTVEQQRFDSSDNRLSMGPISPRLVSSSLLTMPTRKPPNKEILPVSLVNGGTMGMSLSHGGCKERGGGRHDIKPTHLQLFELLFPMAFVCETVIPQNNETLEGGPVTYGEMLRWFGLWFLMATQQGVESRREFWSTKPIDKYQSAPFRLNKDMSRNQFDNILTAVQYTNRSPHHYKDPFHQVGDTIDA
jgi:hypothetical protein